MYFFYMLRCIDNSLYSGVTTNLERRVEEHNAGKSKAAKYTRSRIPVKLVYFEPFPSKADAMKREYEVKQWTKLQKETLVQSQFK